MFLEPLPMAEEAYLADISRAWARLAAYYYRDKPLMLTARHVKNKNKVRQRMLTNRAPISESDEDSIHSEQNESGPPK